jgi:hypothetical protein
MRGVDAEHGALELEPVEPSTRTVSEGGKDHVHHNARELQSAVERAEDEVTRRRERPVEAQA